MIVSKRKLKIVLIFLSVSFLFIHTAGFAQNDQVHEKHNNMGVPHDVMEPNAQMNHKKDMRTEDSSHDHNKMIMAVEQEEPDFSQHVKIEEKLGEIVALDTLFKDENNNEVRLESIFDKPVVILPIFFACPSICGFLQTDLANALNRVDQIPGEDFNVVTLSFSDDEDYTYAQTAKQNYNNLIERDFPLEKWLYLTGDKENIKKLTNSLGYYFIKREKHLYVHPSALVVLAKGGKITRYLYGPNFPAFDLGMALSEAQRGQTGISIKRGVLSFCFDYDPANKTYVFKMFKLTGTAIIVLICGFVIFLLYPSKKEKDKNVS